MAVQFAPIIAIIIAVGNFLFTLVSWIVKGAEWLYHTVMPLILGSRFWVTAIFIGLGVFAIGLFSQVVSAVVNAVFEFSVGSVVKGTILYRCYGFVCSIVPLDYAFEALSFSLSSLLAYYLVCVAHFGFNRIVKFMAILSRAWKI